MYIYVLGVVFVYMCISEYTPHTHIYMELAHVTMEADKSPDLQGESEPADPGKLMV